MPRPTLKRRDETPTGRPSLSKPNFQQVPLQTPEAARIRGAFVADSATQSKPKKSATNFFLAEEVERTIHFGKATLFVVGLQEIAAILKLARRSKVYHKPVSHVFLAANKSYRFVDMLDLLKQAARLLDEGFAVTLDAPAHEYIHLVSKGGSVIHNKDFVLLLHVDLPSVHSVGASIALRFDDNFGGGNGGVWVYTFAELQRDNAFTPWGWYGKDKDVAP